MGGSRLWKGAKPQRIVRGERWTARDSSASGLASAWASRFVTATPRGSSTKRVKFFHEIITADPASDRSVADLSGDFFTYELIPRAPVKFQRRRLEF